MSKGACYRWIWRRRALASKIVLNQFLYKPLFDWLWFRAKPEMDQSDVTVHFHRRSEGIH